jgi:transcriptional regulator with PAS, ATPase and Fis domain
MNVLVSWLGSADLQLMKEDKSGALASIAFLPEKPFDKIIIMANDWEQDWAPYQHWLRGKLAKSNRPFNKVNIRKAPISGPTHYKSIAKYIQTVLIDEVSPKFDSIAINLSSGTGTMTVISVLVGKSLSNCDFYQSSKEQGTQLVEVPIDFKANYQAATDSLLHSVTTSEPRVESAFAQMVTHSAAMKQCIGKAKKLSRTELPALILGETGTGKERLAHAIHTESERGDKLLKIINCGAIQENLIDSILFGHKRGAFTGADSDRKGLFETADGGTVFLDEVGELSADAQVKLLRVLQEKEIIPVGSQIPVTVDVRIIAATHRNLIKMIDKGNFREDLYYRLAVGVLEIPALRERTEDMAELIGALMSEINSVAGKHLEFDSKNISNKVIKFAQEQPWPGNIRELWNTLSRALLWSEGVEMTLNDFKNALQQRIESVTNEQPSLALGKSVDLSQILDSISKSYISKALELTGNNKSKASKMLGFANHQTLLNRMNKLGIE